MENRRKKEYMILNFYLVFLLISLNIFTYDFIQKNGREDRIKQHEIIYDQIIVFTYFKVLLFC